MTISYAKEVPNGSAFGCFWGILWKWRGSVYKLVWRELLAYLVLYYTINFVYRYALNEEQKVTMAKIQRYFYENFRVFEKIRLYFGAQSESIPMSFVLGFYVSLIVKRWWEQYRMLPWPDTLALFISAAIPGQDETGRLMRRNIMRYYCMAYVITLQRISLRVKKRFPTLQHLVDAGLMLESERKIFVLMDAKSPMAKYWMPLVWATNILNRARKEGIIASDHIIQTILFELSDIRRRLGGLIGYDTVCVPLVYTQVVTLVLYSYFMAALMGRQMVPRLNDATGKYEDPDLYFPLFTALQFVFYVGWLKVAEVLINPFGEDDDDIELNWLIDRHIKASYMIVDEMHEEHPELLKDQYWEEVVPKDLPYTVASEHYRKEEPKGSAEDYKIKEADAVYANINPATKRVVNEDNYADYESVDTPMVERRKNWFSRQLTRMGSMRSSSQYSSTGGLFTRNRQNSVYSSPEAQLPGGVPGQMQQNPAKMSFYEKFVGRKSGRTQRQLQKQNSKLSLNGAVMSNAPNRGTRPRIPTPDVTKEVTDRDNRVIFGNSHSLITANHSPVASGVALMTQQLANTPPMYPATVTATADPPLLGTFLLSPIKEMDTASLNNTLHANSPSTLQLAQALQNSGNFTNSPTMPRIITVSSAGDSSETSVVSSSMPVVSVILPTNAASSMNRAAMTHSAVPLSIPVTMSDTTTLSMPADAAIIMETGSVPARRKFGVTRKESLSKSASLDSAVNKSKKEKEAVEKRKSDGGKPSDGKTGEVYV